MSVSRRVNWLSQQRADIPDLRSLESAVSADFDALAQSFFTGPSQGYILRGFSIQMGSAIGGAASSLQVQVDPGAIFHVTSSLSGTFYLVPSGTSAQALNSATNPIVNGAFTPGAINYVSLEYQRLADSTTQAQTYIWDAVQNTETTKLTPRALTLSYTLNISTSIPASNFLPIAVVVTDSSNNVTQITDARWMMFRLGAGGYSPNPFYQFPWSQGRAENVPTATSNSTNPFYGGDKSIGTLKDWMNAVMSSIQEIKGTTYWYSLSTSGSTQSLREDLGNTVITGKGAIAHGVLPSDGDTVTAAGQVNWNQDIFIRVVGSQLAYKLTANPSATYITLSDNQVAYITLVRNQAITPNLIWSNGSAIVTSVGSVSWTSPLQAGDWIKLASDSSAGFYQIQSVDSLTQVTLTSVFTEASTGFAGLQSQYSFGSYQAVASPSTNRHIYISDRGSVPQGQDVFWFLLRSDNTGSPRVYVRFLSTELTQGESEDVSGTTPSELLQYVGSTALSSYLPQYVQTQSTGAVPQIRTLTFGTGSQTPNNSYFYIYSSNNARQYYVWFNKDGAGTDPLVAGKNASVQVAITTSMTAAQVALAVQNALNAATVKDFVAVQSGASPQNVQVTNTSAGTCFAAVDQTVGSPFAVTLNQAGTGIGNNYINDGDSLTAAIKKIDATIAAVVANINNPSYDEALNVISGTPATTNQIQGPISSGTTITLPENSRNGGIQQKYTAARGNLIVLLNGQALNVNESSSFSTDVLTYGTLSAMSTAATLQTSTQKLAVGFTPSASTTVTSVRFYLSVASGTASGNLLSNIYTGNGTIPTTFVGSSSNTLASTVTTSVTAVTITFASPVSLTSGTQYWITLEGDATYNAGSTKVIVAQPTSGVQPYAVTQNNGSAWSTSSVNTPVIDILGVPVTGAYDWSEVGNAGTNQSTIVINRNLVVGDILTFRIISGAVASAGGGGSAVTGPQGPAGPAGTNALFAMTIATKTSNYSVVSADNVLLGDCTSGNITFTLPLASTIPGRVYVFIKIDSSVHTLTIQTTGGQTINGLTSQVISSQWGTLKMVTDGNSFFLY